MKRFWLLALLFLPITVSAQKITSGDLKFLKNETRLNTIIDFSKAQLVGDPEGGRTKLEAFLALDSTYLIQRFYDGVADELEGRYFLVGNQPDARYEAVIQVQQVAEKGKTWSMVEFSNRETKEVLCTVQLMGNGGHFGTFLNLWGDGLRDSGESFGELLRKKSK